MITDEELSNLPDEPELAFVEFEKIIRERTYTALAEARAEDINACRLNYINKVIGAAKIYGINPIKDWLIPEEAAGNLPAFYKKLISVIDHHVIQVRLKNIAHFKKHSVALDGASKTKIHHYIAQIKAIIEEADLEEDKKNDLYRKLNAFANEVDKTRSNIQSAMAVYMTICTGIGEGIEKLEPARKWVDSIAILLGKAKEAEENLPRLTYIEPKKLNAPTTKDPKPSSELLDDEIPS